MRTQQVTERCRGCTLEPPSAIHQGHSNWGRGPEEGATYGRRAACENPIEMRRVRQQAALPTSQKQDVRKNARPPLPATGGLELKLETKLNLALSVRQGLSDGCTSRGVRKSSPATAAA